MSQLLTHSRMACAKSCLRKEFFRYELGLRPIREATALREGSAFHKAMELYDETPDADFVEGCIRKQYETVPTWAQGDEELSEWRIECEKIVQLFQGHIWYWQNDQLEVVWTEHSFEIPIRNPATGEMSRIWNLAGKIDRIVKLSNGRLVTQEYKTTSDDLSSGSDYWKRLRIDSQVSLYVHAARELGHDVRAALYDVTRKPSIRPKLIKGTRETPAEYGKRLAEDIRSRPEFYYARKEIPRLDSDLNEFREELWQQQQFLRECQRSGRWFRNTGSCLGFGRCEYLDICTEHRDVEQETPNGFERTDNIHPELSTLTVVKG